MRRRWLHDGHRNGARRRRVRVRCRRFEALEMRLLLSGVPPAMAPALLDGPSTAADVRPLEVLGTDYGDAPDTYPVLKTDSGAGHRIVSGFYLGQFVDAEPDGQPSSLADADASDDGVIFTPMVSGQLTTITVNASGGGFLDAWLDTNGDGDWEDAGEQILSSEPVASGSNTISFRVVATAVGVPTYARFRLSSAGGLSPTGTAADGEVEDYAVTIMPNPWHNMSRPWDVNGDSHVTPLDALLIINLINANPPISFTPLPVPPEPGFRPPPYYDVNGDGYVTPMDVLLIINYLNGDSAGEGEGPSGAATLVPAAPVPLHIEIDQGILAGLQEPAAMSAEPAAFGTATATTAVALPATELAVQEPADALFATPRAPGDGRQLSDAYDPPRTQLDDLLEDLLRAADELQLVPVSSRAQYFARLARSQRDSAS
ncbi:MAG: dockerin type I domain-containing protein [Pirellulaceae bacterium]|jgi:hypothetical protein|nr:dockerin type I domain-containing protein [Pirellulaceae bacterium]